ncbi:MAG: FtsX-like permease family protein [Bacteroidales bacterium]|nr:FtsX-like permease family protein [Bacteroidales bacterium]
MKIKGLNTAFFIAWRYLFSKKKHNIINIISSISTLGIIVSSAGLIIVLSVFNGMERLVIDNFNTFNADLKIELKEGKSFAVSEFPKKQIADMEAVRAVHEVVSDMVLLTYKEEQTLISLKGVEANYGTDNNIDSIMIDGDYLLQQDSLHYGIIGAIAAGNIRLNLRSIEPFKLYYPKRNRKNLSNTATSFETQLLQPAGVFMTCTEYDEHYLFCSIDFVRTLMDYDGECTSMEVLLQPDASVDKLQAQIAQLLGDKWRIQNRFQQEETLFKTMKSEKLIIYIILSFIMLVAAFNIIGTLGMLIVEKKRDINILYNIGANRSLIQRIFLIEGMLVSFAGGILGLIIGFIICILQVLFHIVKLGPKSNSYIINYYPVEMQATDFVIIFCTLFIISIIVSWIPVRQIKINIKNLNR